MFYLWDNKKIRDVLTKLSDDNNIQHNGMFFIIWKHDKTQEIWFRTYVPEDSQATCFKFSYDTFNMLYEGNAMKLIPTSHTLYKVIYDVVPYNIGESVLNCV